MKLKKLFLLSVAVLSFSSSTAYCSSVDDTSPLTSDTNYGVEISATNDEALSIVTHMYSDVSFGNEIIVGDRILFPVTLVKNNIADSSYFYIPKCNANEAVLLKIEADNNTFVIKSCQEIDNYAAVIEALDNQFQKVLADHPDLNYLDMLNTK